jgi:predicted molibdopterin-dependent oxidoreductase YjgC
VSWEEALSHIAYNLKSIQEHHGSEFIGAVGSPRCTNEDNYVLRKFMRDAVGSNNIDSSAAFGYSKVQKAWEKSFGRKNHPINLNAPYGKDVIFILESDVSVTHPVFGLNILEAKRRGAQLIVADSRETKLTKHSTMWHRMNDGTSVALLNGIMNVIIEKGLLDREAASKLEGFSSLQETLKQYTPQKVSAITGIPEEGIIRIAEAIGNAAGRMISLSVRVSENTKGSDTVSAAANLVNLLGDDPDTLQVPAEYANTYGLYEAGVRPDAVSQGKSVLDMFYSDEPSLKALYIVGEDPVTSFPDSTKVIDSLKSLDFLVVQDIFMTETARLANVVLPASSWAEKDGTFMNAEGREQKVYKLVDPAGQSMPDWMILKNLALTMEKEIGLRSLEDIRNEMREVSREQAPSPDHKAFIPVHYEAGEVPDNEYPFKLVMRDVLQHSGIMSTSSKSLDLVISEALLEINEKDAEKFGISNNTHVKTTSRQGSVYLKAKLSEEVPEGTLFVPTHFPYAKINMLTRLASNGEHPINVVKIEATG